MTDTSSLTNMKDAVMAAIIDLGKEHDDVVMLDADLASCLGSNAFKEKFPNRFFNCGIAEANRIGVGAGLSSMGFTPFAHTFGCFASRRDYDQMFWLCWSNSSPNWNRSRCYSSVQWWYSYAF